MVACFILSISEGLLDVVMDAVAWCGEEQRKVEVLQNGYCVTFLYSPPQDTGFCITPFVHVRCLRRKSCKSSRIGRPASVVVSSLLRKPRGNRDWLLTSHYINASFTWSSDFSQIMKFWMEMVASCSPSSKKLNSFSWLEGCVLWIPIHEEFRSYFFLILKVYCIT